MAPIQTEMYYIRMYTKHPKVTTRHEKATSYVGGYYNRNADPKQIHYIQCNPKNVKKKKVTPCQRCVVCVGSGGNVRVSQHGEFRQVYAKRIFSVVQSNGGYIYMPHGQVPACC